MPNAGSSWSTAAASRAAPARRFAVRAVQARVKSAAAISRCSPSPLRSRSAVSSSSSPRAAASLAAALFLPAPQLFLALLQRLPFLVGVPGRPALELRLAERIEQLALHVRAQQGLCLVLAVKIDEQCAELPQHADRRGAAIHPGA